MIKYSPPVLGALALMALMAPAHAADLSDIGLGAAPSSNLAQFTPETYPSHFVGAYGGLESGASWMEDFSKSTSANVITGKSATNGGVNLGTFGGYNFGNAGSRLIYGVEGDFQDPNTDYRSSMGKAYLNYQASLRARVGYAIINDRFLPFVTGGAAGGNFKTTSYDATQTPTLATNADKIGVGYTLGGGVDMLLTSSIILRAQYIYTSFADQKIDTHEVNLGIGYKF